MIFNLLPALLILVTNVTLCLIMRKNKNKKNERLQKSSINGSKNNLHKLSKSQKSHFFTIISLGIWQILTNIHYFVLITFDRARLLRITNLKYTSLQAVSSIFFNSNHCVNILIYLIFYKEFGLIILDLFRFLIIRGKNNLEADI
jgi:hypothetical protein